MRVTGFVGRNESGWRSGAPGPDARRSSRWCDLSDVVPLRLWATHGFSYRAATCVTAREHSCSNDAQQSSTAVAHSRAACASAYSGNGLGSCGFAAGTPVRRATATGWFGAPLGGKRRIPRRQSLEPTLDREGRQRRHRIVLGATASRVAIRRLGTNATRAVECDPEHLGILQNRQRRHSACSPPSNTNSTTPQPPPVKQADRARPAAHLRWSDRGG